MRHYLHYVGHATELSAQLTQEVQGRLAGMAAQRRDFMFSAAMLALASLLLMSLLWLLTSLWLTRPLGVIAGALGQLNHAARWPQQSPAGEAALPLDLGTLSDVEALAHTRNTMVRELARAVVTFVRTLEARQQIQPALDAERHRLKSLVRGMPGLVWLKDAEGIFLQCNRHFEDLLGHPEAELLGKTDYDRAARAGRHVPPERPAGRAGGPLAEQRGVADLCQRPAPRAGADHQDPALHARGRAAGRAGVATDITDARAAEEALRASEARCAAPRSWRASAAGRCAWAKTGSNGPTRPTSCSGSKKAHRSPPRSSWTWSIPTTATRCARPGPPRSRASAMTSSTAWCSRA
jgi:PAS domain-containing protein